MKLINFFLFFIFISVNFSFADINKEFENWKLNFKKIALENNIINKSLISFMQVFQIYNYSNPNKNKTN